MGYVKIVARAPLVAAALLAIAAPAFAQQAPDAASIPQSRETEIDLAAGVTYNSNVAASDAEIAAARHLTLADELFIPEVDFILARPVGNQIVFLKGNAGYIFHRVNTVLNRQDVDVTGGVNAKYLRCQEVVTGEYISNQSDLNEIPSNVVRNILGITTVAGTVNCGRSVGFAPSLSIAQTWRDNSAKLLQSTNSNNFSLSPSIAYQQPAFGSVSIFGAYDNVEYPNRILQLPNRTFMGGYDLYAIGARYDRHIGARLNGTGSVSYTSLVENIPGTTGFSGLTYSFDVTYQVSSRLAAHGDAIRATVPSNRIGANYSINETFEGDVSYQLGRSISLKLMAQSLNINYQSIPHVQQIDLTHETQNEISANVVYQLNKRFSFTVTAGDLQRNANFPGLTYNSVTVGLQAKASF